MNLDGRTALVTGSSRNIGRSIAIRLAEAGADVGITARNDRDGCERTASLVEETGSESAISLGSLADPDTIESIVDDIEGELGPVDVLVNNASIRPVEDLLDVDVEEWDRVHQVDLRAMFLLAQRVLPNMIKQEIGAIVNIIGITAFTGLPGKTHVVANKMGIVGLTRSLASEFGRDGVRVNALALGPINTDRDRSNYEAWEEMSKRFRQASSLGRLGEPREAANACAFLCSEQASFMTGQVLHVNGGLYPNVNIANI